MTLSTLTLDLLRELQTTIGKGNESRGFHEDRPKPMRQPGSSVAATNERNAQLAQWQGNKLLLIVSEVVEAHDEIRNGVPAAETYYPTRRPNEPGIFKPEGVPSEIADAVIRCFDFAYTEGFDLAGIIAEKLAYNETRPYKHGKKF